MIRYRKGVLIIGKISSMVSPREAGQKKEKVYSKKVPLPSCTSNPSHGAYKNSIAL
jgi:hypothetical protein